MTDIKDALIELSNEIERAIGLITYARDEFSFRGELLQEYYDLMDEYENQYGERRPELIGQAQEIVKIAIRKYENSVS